MTAAPTIRQSAAERILVLDGAMGTMIQAAGLVADDFGGADLEGCKAGDAYAADDVAAPAFMER